MEKLRNRIATSYTSGRRPSGAKPKDSEEFMMFPPWLTDKTVMGVDFEDMNKHANDDISRRMDSLKFAHSVMQDTDVSSAPSWLIGDLGIVYDAQTKLNMGPPNLSVVLSSLYLDWPKIESRLPALFLKLCPIYGDPVILEAHRSVSGIPAIKASSIVMFSLSPEIYGMFVPDEVMKDGERTLSFMVKSEDFRKAVKFYADAYASRSPLLNVYSTLTMPKDAEGMMLKFRIPDMISTAELPKIKRSVVTSGVSLKISLYGRDYTSFSDY